MVATWNPAAASSYYIRQRETEYYTDSYEPEGGWYAPARDFGLVDGATVDRSVFERLYEGRDGEGHALIEKLRRHAARTPAFDVTLSAPRSVSLAWAFAPQELREAIEVAQARAARATLSMLEREAIWARRGRNGAFLEKVALSAATFLHGESRMARHADGATFGDPNLHTHCVILNLATRADCTVGALHSKILRDFKMAAGAIYHAELSHQLQQIGFEIDRVGKNGVFELAGVAEDVIRYFSARRNEIETELAAHGVNSAEAVALAAAITKASRISKRPLAHDRREVWRQAARSQGIDVDGFTIGLLHRAQILGRDEAERLLDERLKNLPMALTEHESVIDRRELVRSIAAALVGTGWSVERANAELEGLLNRGAVVEVGRDVLGMPRYSTPEMLRIERDVVRMARQLAGEPWRSIEVGDVDAACRRMQLREEQIEAVRAATEGTAVAVIEGAPGTGKTTTLAPVVELYRAQGCTVLGSATAWRVATMLGQDLGIESRATASWIARIETGQRVMDKNTVLIVDEAGLLSSRDMHALLSAVTTAEAKLVLVGDRRQLQPIGAGPGLDLVSRAVQATRIETIIRQKEAWMRQAVTAFGQGKAEAALEAFAEHGLLVEASGAKAALDMVLDRTEALRQRNPNGNVLILAKTNSAVASISRAMRERLKMEGLITGPEVAFTAATPSGHNIGLQLARGDKIRFLVRNDDLAVINGTVGTVLRVRQASRSAGGPHGIRIDVEVDGRKISFDPMTLSDPQGRPRIGWAYASTVAGAQGMTVDDAVVLLDPVFSRHDCLVAASRARDTTALIVDRGAIDRRLAMELPIDRQRDDMEFSLEERRRWLAERLSRAALKVSTLDVIETPQTLREHERRYSQSMMP